MRNEGMHEEYDPYIDPDTIIGVTHDAILTTGGPVSIPHADPNQNAEMIDTRIRRASSQYAKVYASVELPPRLPDNE